MLVYIILSMAVTLTVGEEYETVEADTAIGRVKGRQEPVLGKNIDVFTGIPFALPPVGKRRFKRPEPPEPWEGELDATELPNSCVQAVDTSFNRFPGVEMWNPNTNMSEDCLYLNVWAPAERSYGKARAVFVWVFGGSFAYGSSTLSIYDGRILAALGDVVVVSMNYRAGPLGFLYLGTPEAPGNMGLLDQQMAIRWIYNYIDAFGGDKTRITLVGESAGAGSVSLHLLSPISQDLIKSAIMESGTAVAPWCVDPKATARARTIELATRMGCEGSDDDIMECLNSKEALSIADQTWLVPDGVSVLAVPFAPTIDDFFISEMPSEMMKQGKYKRTPILLGANKDEGTFFLFYHNAEMFTLNRSTPLSKQEYRQTLEGFFKKYRTVGSVIDALNFEYNVPYVYSPEKRYRDVLDDMVGDYCFICPVVEFANAYADGGNDVYMYRFLHRTSSNPWPDWTGAMHGYEIDHIFGAPLNTSLPEYTDKERELSQRMLTYWTNFVKTG